MKQMASGWEKDKAWSDQFIPEIKSILGRHLITEAPIEEDQKRNTDLMVLCIEAIRVGCRVRRVEFVEKYGDEFTLRVSRPSGVKTELEKIMNGWGDYFFYGFGQNRRLVRWTLASLDAFRSWYNSRVYRERLADKKISNHDNSSELMAFKWQSVGPGFIVGRNWDKPKSHTKEICKGYVRPIIKKESWRGGATPGVWSASEGKFIDR